MTYIDELDSNIAFEEQRTDDEIWTREYLDGYIAGLKQAREMFTFSEGKYYTVQRLHIYDVKQAIGDDTIVYTDKEMKDLAEFLEEETYDGDAWGTAIRKFNDNK